MNLGNPWHAAVACLAIALSVASPSALAARQAPANLSLEEAVDLALRHNPTFLAQQESGIEAEWAVREAYGQLLPGAFAGMGFQYQARGQPLFGVFTGDDLGVGRTPSYYFSDYSVGLRYQLGGATLYRPGRQRALRDATRARTDGAAVALAAEVTHRYLALLRARDARDLAARELERAGETVRLAGARAAVGAASRLELMQAEVERGRAQAALVQATGHVRIDELRLVQAMGIELDREVRLTTRFAVADPDWTADELTAMALASNPQLEEARALGAAGDAGVRMARSAYLPTVELSAGWSGFTRQATDTHLLLRQAHDRAASQVQFCDTFNRISAGLSQPLPGYPVDCTSFLLTAEDEARLLRRNQAFPFDYTRQPMMARLQVSLPLFQGLSRQYQLEAARVAANEARHRLRAEELRIRADVTAAHLNLESARQVVSLEAQNVELATAQHRLARESYELGTISFVELMEAETLRARADRAHLAALYAYHESFAALELAVGRRLRPSGEVR